jgi:HEPN domain-containing protein
MDIGRLEWACFACHQAAEKAVKALHLAHGEQAWGHVISRLLRDLPTSVQAPAYLVERARVLDNASSDVKVPARYPNGHPEGAPFEHYVPLQSEEAIRHARAILDFVRHQMA